MVWLWLLYSLIHLFNYQWAVVSWATYDVVALLTPLLYHTFQQWKNAIFLECPVLPLGFPWLYYTIYFLPQKIWIFWGSRGRKNHSFDRIRTVGLWVVFLETDCKISNPKHPKLPIHFPTSSPTSKSPPFPHLSTTFSTSQIPIVKPTAQPNTITVVRNTTPSNYFGFPK